MSQRALTGSIQAADVEATSGPGYAVSSLEQMGDGPGFRKVRRELGVTAFGINALVLPPGYKTGVHYHDEQEETYFVHAGTVEFRFGDGSTHVARSRADRPGRMPPPIAGCATSARATPWSSPPAARTATWGETASPSARTRAAARRALLSHSAAAWPSSATPVLLLHGQPGGARDWGRVERRRERVG